MGGTGKEGMEGTGKEGMEGTGKGWRALGRDLKREVKDLWKEWGIFER